MTSQDLSPFSTNVFQALAENAPEAILIANAQANFVYANRAAHQLFKCNYEKREMIGAPATHYWLEQDLPILNQTVIPQAMAGSFTGEVRNKRADGSVFYAQASAFRVLDAQTQTGGLGIILRDISERKRTEEALRDIIACTSDWMWEVNAQGCYTYCSESVADVLGYTVQEVLGKTPFDFMLPEEAARIGAIFGEAAAQRQPIKDLENLNRHKDGHTICLLANGVPILDVAGNLIGYRGVDRDITERKQAETELLREKALSDTIINSMPGLFYLVDAKGRYVRWNQNYEKVTGYSSEEVRQIDSLNLVVEQDRPRLAVKMQEAFTTGQASAETQIATKRGEEIPYYFTGTRMNIGNEVYLVGMGIDLTERKQVEAERAQLQAQVIEAQRHALQELSTPIIPVLDRIIVMPLIGSIDTLRAKDVTRALLAGISQYRAKIVIVDITGVPLVDSGVADHLNKTIQAARLKGAQTIVTGMSDAVAEAIVDLGIDWSGIQTLSDLQTGLLSALDSLGFKLGRK